jgi:glycosyltransferase involved in cell wall biosynthesis
LLSAILGKKTILELHHELTGFSKILYNFVHFFKFDKNLKYIFIHQNLIKKFNSIKHESLCLDDAIDINDYLVKFKSKILKKTCVYVGSFYPGKGLEIISYISKKLPDFNFHLYGDRTYLPSTSFEKNIHFFGHVNYKEIPNILSKYEVALMPYLSRVSGRHKNLNLANNMSPLKMFDYLASGKIILATNLKVYGHILKNNYNAILVDENKIDDWIFWIKKIFKNPDKFSNLKKNSFITAKKYTWTNRGKKIKKFIVEKYF